MTIEFLDKVSSLAEAVGFTHHAQRLSDARDRAAAAKIHLVVVGEFNRGKSTLVNALIGRSLLPMDIVPTTAAIWTVEQGEGLSVELVGPNRRTTSVDTDPACLVQISAGGELANEEVHHVRATVPTLAVGPDIVVVDTPGVNDINTQRADITYGYLEAADVAVVVLDASSPLTRSEAEFVQGQLLATTIHHTIFVLNKSSRLDNDEIEDAREFTEERLEALLEQPPRVAIIDAEMILRAIIEGKSELARQWGWEDFKTVLTNVLVEAGTREARQTDMQAKVALVLEQFLGAVEAELSTLRQDQSTALELADTFEQGKRHRRDCLERLLCDAATYGRDRLKHLLSESMHQECDRFLEAMDLRIAGMAEVGPFARDVLPKELQLMTKRWFEHRLPDIERFTSDLNRHLSMEYTRHFQRALMPVSIQQEALAPSTSIEARVTPLESTTQRGMEAALPAAGYIALAFLHTGPFAILGLVGGTLVSKHMANSRRAEEKDRLRAELPDLVRSLLATPLASLHEAVDSWHAALLDTVKAQYQTAEQATRARFDTSRQLTDKSHREARMRELQDTILRTRALEATCLSTSSI